MVTKISKWSRIQDSCRITPKIESLVVYAMPDILSKFQKDRSITFWVILLTHKQTNRQTKTGKNITSLAEVIKQQTHTNSRSGQIKSSHCNLEASAFTYQQVLSTDRQTNIGVSSVAWIICVSNQLIYSSHTNAERKHQCFANSWEISLSLSHCHYCNHVVIISNTFHNPWHLIPEGKIFKN